MSCDWLEEHDSEYFSLDNSYIPVMTHKKEDTELLNGSLTDRILAVEGPENRSILIEGMAHMLVCVRTTWFIRVFTPLEKIC